MQSGSSSASLVSPASILPKASSKCSFSCSASTALQSARLSTQRLQQLLQTAVIFWGAISVTKGKRPTNQNCWCGRAKRREWSRRRLVVSAPSRMQMRSVRETLLYSQSISPASVVASLIFRLSLRCSSCEGHSLAGLLCSTSLKMYCLTSSRYSCGSSRSISSTFFFRYSWYSSEQRILKYSSRSMRSSRSFFLISSLCSSNCSNISSSSSSRRESSSGSEWILLRQKPKRKPSKQRQMMLQTMSSGAPAEMLPQAAEEAVPSDQYIVQRSWMPKPSPMMSGQAETLTQSSCGCEQSLLLRARSSSKNAQPTQLTMMIRMNSPQKTLQTTQKGVPMMQDRKRRWKATILQTLKRQTSQTRWLAGELPSQANSKTAMARQSRSQASSALRMPSHLSLTTQLRKRIFLEISGLRTTFRTRWSRQRQMCSRKTTRMAMSSSCVTPASACSSQLNVTFTGKTVRIRKRQISTTKQSAVLKIRSQQIEQYRSSAYYSGVRFVKSTIDRRILYGKIHQCRAGSPLLQGLSLQCCSRCRINFCEISQQPRLYCPKGSSKACLLSKRSVVPKEGWASGGRAKGLWMVSCWRSLGARCTKRFRIYSPGPGPACIPLLLNRSSLRISPKAALLWESVCSSQAPGPGGGRRSLSACSVSREEDLVRSCEFTWFFLSAGFSTLAGVADSSQLPGPTPVSSRSELSRLLFDLKAAFAMVLPALVLTGYLAAYIASILIFRSSSSRSESCLCLWVCWMSCLRQWAGEARWRAGRVCERCLGESSGGLYFPGPTLSFRSSLSQLKRWFLAQSDRLCWLLSSSPCSAQSCGSQGCLISKGWRPLLTIH